MMRVDLKQLSELTRTPTDRQTFLLDRARAATRRSQALLAGAAMEVPEARWFALIISTSKAKAVDKLFEEHGIARFRPMRSTKVKRRSRLGCERIETREYDEMPGYLFVKVAWTDETYELMRGLDGALGMLGGWVKPRAINDREFVEMKEYLTLTPAQRRKVDAVRLRRRKAIGVGDDVMVVGDALDGLAGQVVGDVDDTTMLVEIFFLGRLSRARIDLANLVKAI